MTAGDEEVRLTLSSGLSLNAKVNIGLFDMYNSVSDRPKESAASKTKLIFWRHPAKLLFLVQVLTRKNQET